MNVSDLYIYPVKSTFGERVDTSLVKTRGMVNDRRWIVTDEDGKAITGREVAVLSLVTARVGDSGLSLSQRSLAPLTVPFPSADSRRAPVRIWSDVVDAVDAGDAAAQWLTAALSRPCRLYFMDDHSERRVAGHASTVSFADAFPVLLTNTASATDLATRAGEPMDIRRFRPNIVVDGALAYEEDTWRRIRIGEVEFEVHSPCERCSFTTINPDNADSHPRQEPLRTLAKYRRTPEGEVCFGQNIIAVNVGTIRSGDPVEILEQGSPRPAKLR